MIITVDVATKPCANHPNRKTKIDIDGKRLCEACANILMEKKRVADRKRVMSKRRDK